MPNDDGYDYRGGSDLWIREHIFNQDQVIYPGQAYLFFVKNSGLSTGVPHLTYIQ